MPMYSYRCEMCGKEWENHRFIADRDKEACCGQKAARLITSTAKPVVYDYYSENLDAYVTGPAQKSRVMKSKDVEEA